MDRKRLMINLILITLLIINITEVILAEPTQTASIDRTGENETAVKLPSDRFSNISFSDVIMLVNLILAAVNILLTYSVGRRHNF